MYKGLRCLPGRDHLASPQTAAAFIATKLLAWVEAVESTGLESVRKVPGYHDEPLRGERAGQRSIRLSRSYRAIYELRRDSVEFVSIEEVNKHDY